MMKQQRIAGIIVAVVSLIASPAWLRAADAGGEEFFEKQVRPILVARCYECHSAQAPKILGGLRVDSRAALLQGGDTGPALVPGKAKESLLVDAINYGDVYQMPPKSKLPAEEIATLTKWVEMGAPWPAEKAAAAVASAGFNLVQRRDEHWCWQPIQNPPLPVVKNAAWPHQPLDRFILAKLEAQGLSPAPPADRRTLIRRAYFDLIGLPPTPEEVQAFLDDTAPQAFERVVERLLDSPHFGERWGRHWLDLMRYAESRGHEFDYNVPNAYQYRDYVIRALNADVPYDRFVAEHLAGDLLPEPRRHPREGFNESILGTGFWFLGEWIHSPVDIRKDETDRLDNMVDVFSKAFLGLTVSCARCHDHKFDAISQRDYYALFGYLQSASYRLARFDTAAEEQRATRALASLDGEFRPRLARLLAKQLEPLVEKLAAKMPQAAEALEVQTPVTEVAGEKVEIVADFTVPAADEWRSDGPTFGGGNVPAGTLLLAAEGQRFPIEVATYGAARRDRAWNGLAWAAGAEGDPGKLSGWVRAGRTLKTETFTLKSGQLRYLVKGKGHVYAAVASHATINGPLHGQLIRAVEGSDEFPPRWLPHDLRAYAGQRVHVEFSPQGEEDFQVLAVVQADESPQPLMRANKLVAQVEREIPAEQSARREAAYRELLDSAVKRLGKNELATGDAAADWSPLIAWMLEQLETPTKELAELADAYRVAREEVVKRVPLESRLCLAMWEGSGVDETLLIRGNTKTIGPVVPRQMLEAIEMAFPDALRSPISGSGRLELAQQVTHPANPLTSRVMANRIWQHLLGRGIVPSVDNFGVLGQLPTHPELLDHLAWKFREDGWSLKRTIRSIMLSSTYQMASSASSPPATDPENLLLHRANIKRLEGEAVRDAILAISGRLDRTQFGPSIPVHLTPFMQGRGRPAASGPLDGAGRRSIYTAVRRNFLSPLMLAFDTPIPASAMGQRNVSNVPAQALILMNDPLVVEQARLWAKKSLTAEGLSAEQRIARMYAAAFARPPTAAETAAAVAFLDKQAREYGAERADNDQRVWADLAHVLFNVKEFVFVR